MHIDNDNTKKLRIQVTANTGYELGYGWGYGHTKWLYIECQGLYFAEVSDYLFTPKPNISKLSKYTYLDLSTGDVRMFNLDAEIKGVSNIRRSMKRLKGLIRANFGIDQSKERHITLTYRSNMRDTVKLYKDFDKWYKRLKYHYSDQKFEYIVVAEPQARGAWHLHLLLKSDKELWLDYNRLGNMWRAVTKEKVANPQHSAITADDVGTYFVAYFSTIIPEEVELSGDREAIKAASKAAQKGSRIGYYPLNFKFYRCSRGIYRPMKGRALMEDLEDNYDKVVSDYTIEVTDNESGKTVQEIQRMVIRSTKKDSL